MQLKRLPSLFLLFLVSISYGQATFTSGSSATDLATQITGPGITISSPVITNGTGTQVGIYSNGIAGAGLQLDAGIILTTGDVTESFSTNSATGISLGPGSSFSDADLTAIDANATNDVVIFQFDAVLDPLATVLTIDYQFMSDEYNEYVCSTFNDVFGYFVSGPGITGTQNIALVPGTANPVTIASINNGSVGINGDIANCIDLTQSALFTDNTGGTITMEYDGITNKIRASATGLTPGETYTVKFAIADVADGAFDSAILIDVISGFPDDDDDGIANDADLDDDNDGIYDTEEDDNLDNDNNPLSNPTDTDMDGIPNYLDLDSDGDGIPDNIEAQTTNGYVAPGTFTDANLDGVNDVYAGGLTPVNTDNTDNPDYLDTDADNDGTDDQTEAGITLTGNIGANGLDNGLESIDDYSDVNGTLDDPTTLPDSDGDVGSGGDVDYRDTVTSGDNDNDTVNDDVDLDDDNDGIYDTVESQCSNPSIQFAVTPVSYWTLDNTTDDSVGANNENGSASVTYSTTAIQGTHSIDFDGATSVRYSVDGAFMETTLTAMSFSAWILPSALSGTQIIYEEGGATHGAVLWIDGTTLTYSTRTSSTQTNVQHPTALSLDGLWHHVAGVYDNGNLTVYLDGIPSSTVVSGTTTIPAHSNNGGIGGAVGGASALGTTGFYTGLMDAVRYSNTTAWSSGDINIEGQRLCDEDSDGVYNHLDLDSDGDGIPDNVEAQLTNSYTDPGVFTDGNGDGVNDVYAGGLTPVNTDGTDNEDYLDTDSDNEGSDDTTEASLTLAGAIGVNGLDTNIATSADYSDVNGTINDPTTLPDSDSDLGTGGDVDFRDDTVDVTLGSGNLLWLRADIQASTSLWEDQSGNDRDATSGVTADPTLNNNEINFYPAFDFNGSTQSLNISGGILGTDSYTGVWIYIVSSTDVIQNSSIFREEIASGERFGSHLPWGDSNLYFDFGTVSPTSGRINAVWGSSVNTFNLWNYGNSNSTSNPSSSNKSLYRDGLLFATNATFDATVQGNSQDFQIATDGTNFHDGKLAEIIVFADVPTSLEQQKVQSYLAIKYGITLDTSDNDAGVTEGDYIASDETTKYWDFTANSTYHNDVAGIGRDDTQVLDHKQSKSVSSDRIVTIGLGTIASDNASNANSFAADKDFLVWGNDNVALGATSTSGILCATDLRLDRNWKIVETGSVGTVQIAAIKSTLDTYLTNTDRSKAIIVADDASYTTNVEFVSLTEQTIDGVTQYAGTFDFDGTKFFTFVEVGGVTWKGSAGVSGEWQGSGDGPLGAPSDTDDLELLTIDADGTSNNATLIANAEVGCVWVTAGSKLVVSTGQLLQITDQLFLEGEIRLIGSAQLVQTHTGASQVTGSGSLYVDQQGTVETVYRYNYWTSPVNSVSGTGFRVGDVMKDGTTPTSENSTPPDINFTSGLDGALTTPITISNYWIYGFLNGLDENNWVQQLETGTFEISEGYILKGPGAAQNYTFVGSPNDGDYTTSISAGFLSLLGNPYPSAIDSQQFFTDNTGVIETLYFWEHKDDSNSHATGGYIGGYGLLNESMSVAGVAPFNDDTGGQGGFVYTAPGRYIPIGQGFFASADGAGTVTFNNSQRAFQLEIEDGGSDSVFFRNGNSNDEPDTNEQGLPILKLGLDYTNDEGSVLHRQIGISFKQGNTYAKDVGYDSPIFDLNPTDMYFNFIGTRQNFVIAGIEEISDDLEFPIAIQISNSNEVTFRIDEIYNIERTVFLEDKVTQQIYDLSDPIELSIPIGTYTDRFYIKFGESSLSNTNPELNDLTVFIDENTEELVVKNIPNSIQLLNVIIYNILGQKVRQWNVNTTPSENRFSVKGINSNVYMIHINSDEGKIVKKLMKE